MLYCSFFTSDIKSLYCLFAIVTNYIYAHSKSDGSWENSQAINSQTGINTLSIVNLDNIESIYLNGVRINRKPINSTIQGNLIMLGKYPGYSDSNQHNIKGLRIYSGPNVYPDVDNVTVPTLPLTKI